MKFLNKKILVEPIKEKQTQSGIHIPLDNNEKIGRGKIIAFDESIPDLKVGDILIHSLAYDEFGDNRVVDITDVWAIEERNN